jgi:hypothetical protein
MPGKNIIVRMADRLRAGKTHESQGATHAAADSFASRQHILAQLGKRLALVIAGDRRFATIRYVAKPSTEQPERLMLVFGERVVTIRIAPDTDTYHVGGSGLGKRFSANPAHLQSDDIVLLTADEASNAPFGSEFTALDFLEDLCTRVSSAHPSSHS